MRGSEPGGTSAAAVRLTVSAKAQPWLAGCCRLVVFYPTHSLAHAAHPSIRCRPRSCLIATKLCALTCDLR